MYPNLFHFFVEVLSLPELKILGDHSPWDS